MGVGVKIVIDIVVAVTLHGITTTNSICLIFITE